MAVIPHHRDALEAVKTWLPKGPGFRSEATAAFTGVPIAAVGELVAEVERLRAERQPFRAVLDAAFEGGLAAGKAPASVLELAERLGFLKPLPVLDADGCEFLFRHGTAHWKLDADGCEFLFRHGTAHWKARVTETTIDFGRGGQIRIVGELLPGQPGRYAAAGNKGPVYQVSEATFVGGAAALTGVPAGFNTALREWQASVEDGDDQ